ncbi:DNA cytosine methyltransferase [Thermococcus argininiproducens]|uniref:DNA cytosine methyltransferase n=1 Tax=Thermococcus argininiproducens TaxID=2866384 RepID=A0A9E7SBK6_9EURY|nr:DNA cytosine methyltransferase [Thermococcus argininiproducens]USG98974.1 DNA cytosine methyltransferase [Thermococcus argininiproducens]
MKKLPLIMMGLLIFSLVPYVESASVGKASIDQVMLGLGESVTFGDYKIQFADVDQAWTQALIKVYAKDGSPVTSKVLPTGYSLPVPDAQNPIFYVRVSWILASNQKILISLESDLELVQGDVNITKNGEYSLPYKFNDVVIPAIKIKVTNTYDNKVDVQIKLPYETVTQTIFEGDYYGVAYKLNGDFQYSPYLYLYLKNATTSYAVFDVYLPKYPTTVFQLGEGETGGTTPSAPSAEPTELVYNDIMYEGENLTITLNETSYTVKLNSVGYYSSFSVFEQNNEIATFRVKEGKSYQLSEAPLRIEIPLHSVDLEYNRVQVKIYAPQGSEVSPIIREAEIKAELSVSTEKLLLNDELVLFVNIRNQGRGKAFDVKIVVPIPTGFELKSSRTWNLKTLEPFTEVPALFYTLKPIQVGTYKMGPASVTYYKEDGQEESIISNTIDQVVVYAIPKLSVTGEAFNGTWSTYVHTQEKTVKLKFTISAEGKDPKYEFIKNATLQLELPDSMDGETKLYVGDIKAGETKTLESDYAILKADNAIINAKLVYQDPLGNWHEESFGNLVVVNSLPPAIEIKEVKVYPAPDELPSYVNRTLAELDNDSKVTLAEALQNITIAYLPEKGISWWPILTVLFIIVSAVLGYNYVDLKSKYDKALKELGRKKRRPGGIPKKEEAQKTEEIQSKEEQL